MNEAIASTTQPRRADRWARAWREGVRRANAWLHARVSLGWRLFGVGVLGVLVAAGVGYETSLNSHAAPPHLAVIGRVSIILVLIGVGIYAQTSRLQARMGSLLVAAGFYASLWLLNGSSNSLLFSVGVPASPIAMIALVSLLMLYPTGKLHSRLERRLLTLVGGAMLVSWLLLAVSSRQPEIHTPLVQCAPHCPANALFLGLPAGGALVPLKAIAIGAWFVLAWGTWVLVQIRGRSAPAPLRPSLIPVQAAAFAYVVLLTLFLALGAAHVHPASGFGAATVGIAIFVPLAILIGFYLERLFMGRLLADFVSELGRAPGIDPQPLMARALRDPTLQIGYVRRGAAVCVDSSGTVVQTARLDPRRTVTWIRRGERPIAAVVYDAELSNQARFVQAAGAAALLRLERAQLEADLKASTTELAASRARLVDAADAERQRMEHDLHDSIQQDLVSVRIRLEMAAEALSENSEDAQRMIGSVGRQMDDVLETVRTMARGVYPTLLHDRGLGVALSSAARRLPMSVSVDSRGVGRCPEDVERGVYFCCLEALQNFIKHAGRQATAEVRLRQEPGWLHFEVCDSGVGFDPGEVNHRTGLVNMYDRIEAVGGSLAVISRRGHGTQVRGDVPLGVGSVR